MLQSVLQYMLQCVAVGVALCCSVLHFVAGKFACSLESLDSVLQILLCCSVLQCVAVCVEKCFAVRYSVCYSVC